MVLSCEAKKFDTEAETKPDDWFVHKDVSTRSQEPMIIIFVEGQIDAIATSIACIKSVEVHQCCQTNSDGPMSAGPSRAVSNFRSDWQGFYVNFVLSEKDRSSFEKCVESGTSLSTK